MSWAVAGVELIRSPATKAGTVASRVARLVNAARPVRFAKVIGSSPFLMSLREVIRSSLAPSFAVLLVRHLLHPRHRRAVQLFLNGDVGHRGGRGGPVPVLDARRDTDDVAGADLLGRTPLP